MAQYYHLFPFERIEQGSKLVLYGAGEVGQWYLTQLKHTGFADVVAISDKSWDKYPNMGVPLVAPEKIAGLIFDYVMVSIEKQDIARDVANMLVHDIGIPEEKVILGSESLCIVPHFQKAGAVPTLAFEAKGIPVAVFICGGLGDLIMEKRKLEEVLAWDRRIVVDIFIKKKSVANVEALFQGEYVDRINAIIPGDEILYNQQKDKYAIGLNFSMSCDLEVCYNERLLDKAPQLHLRCERLRDQCEAYGHWTEETVAVHFLRCQKDGLNCYTSCNRYDGFNVIDFHTHIPLQEAWKQKYLQMEIPEQYITINCGFSMKDVQMHKAWPMEHFEAFVKLFKEVFPSIGIVQVDGTGFPRISDCDNYFIGENLEMVKFILKGAVLHIGIEGGLAHLATQLGTKCIVLFGPTYLSYYGYADNINLRAGDCHECNYLMGDWYTCCRHLAKPVCMLSITPEMVMEAAEGYLKGR